MVSRHGKSNGDIFRHLQALVDPKNPRWPPLSKIAAIGVGGIANFFPIAPRIKHFSAILWFLGMGN